MLQPLAVAKKVTGKEPVRTGPVRNGTRTEPEANCPEDREVAAGSSKVKVTLANAVQCGGKEAKYAWIEEGIR